MRMLYSSYMIHVDLHLQCMGQDSVAV